MLFKTMGRSANAFLIVLPIIGCVVWFFLKVFQFQTSPEQYPDGMVILQLSKGWLEGRPFLFDTIYGNHAQQHNYYFIPLIGIFTRFMGVNGLFMAYVCFVGLFFWVYNRGSAHFNVAERRAIWLTALVYIFGPMAYFMYLDYFGWHPEQYFIPLLAFLALSFAQRKWGMFIVWLTLVFLVKESSIVLICCLFLFYSVVDQVILNPSRHWFRYIFNKRNLLITSVSVVIFLIGLWWLSYLNGSQSSRLNQAFSNTQLNTTFFYHIVFSVAVGALTFGLGLIPFMPWLRTFPRKGLIIWVLAGCFGVLFVMFATEALYYFPAIYPGVSYPPRISGLWAFMLSAFVYLSYRVAQAGFTPGQNAINWILTGCLLQFIFGTFLVAHHFTFDTKPSAIAKSASYMIKTGLGFDPYPEGDARQLHGLAKEMPVGSEVIVPFQYLRYFERVYPSFWPQDGRLPAHILGRPLMYVYEKELVQNGAYHVFPAKGYKTIPNEHLLILADSSWYNLKFK
ncbi:hypothetical protein [Dyadobacter psychrophilus]|uniref:4-amino-4-deoxy-L-arabinose transferase n=1 Tax=Dyadobacter psychrophilus TaxID=651661 RepID=A0A1T5E4R3_9BACT|nr:hypothetical protein [Dyadobacter psychrophilus]SKB78867.1 hypothetical protein SAMN05660293_02156 [Dyadobacter psychrophilus]